MPVQYEEFLELVRTRRSVRKYRDEEVPDELIMKALEAAVWAPSGGSFQPWQLIVVKNREVIHRMADAMDARSHLMASWPEAEPFREHADRWLRTGGFFRHAPVCIAVLVGAYQSVADRMLAARGPHDPQAVEMAEWRRFGASRIQTIGGLVMTMLLALHQQGLGATWMAGPQQAKAEVEEILQVPKEYEFVALVPVGWPAEQKEGSPRKPMDQVVRFIR